MNTNNTPTHTTRHGTPVREIARWTTDGHEKVWIERTDGGIFLFPQYTNTPQKNAIVGADTLTAVTA